MKLEERKDDLVLTGAYRYCPVCGARMLERLSTFSYGSEIEIYVGKLNFCSKCGAELKGEANDKKSDYGV